MHQTKPWMPAALALAACAGLLPAAQAQSSDALIDKLVDKGILTTQEARELREEVDKGFTQAHQVKTGLPDWVSTLKISGDFRARYDGIDNPDDATDRNRFRYRLRVGAVATIRDNFELGFRLTSSEPVAGGGDPISGNASYADNGSKKSIFIDQAYAKWTALNTPDFMAMATVGKMENPFVFSEMIFDPDYTPEGAALNFAFNASEQHVIRFNAGGFMLDELGADSNDPFLVGTQLRWDAAWTPKIQSSAGVGLLNIVNAKSQYNNEGLATGTVPDVNGGNSRSTADASSTSGTDVARSTLDNSFSTFVADAALTYNLESFPMYTGMFPIRLGVEYAENFLADDRNQGYAIGITFGKAGRKGLWEVSYKWKEMQGDFWYEEVVDSDFGGFNPTATAFSGAGTGYRAGTNLRGHMVRAQYSPYDALTLAATLYIAEVIDSPASNGDTRSTRVQVDASLKF